MSSAQNNLMKLASRSIHFTLSPETSQANIKEIPLCWRLMCISVSDHCPQQAWRLCCHQWEVNISTHPNARHPQIWYLYVSILLQPPLMLFRNHFAPACPYHFWWSTLLSMKKKKGFLKSQQYSSFTNHS